MFIFSNIFCRFPYRIPGDIVLHMLGSSSSYFSPCVSFEEYKKSSQYRILCSELNISVYLMYVHHVERNQHG